jgi:hypothetical protein
MMLRRNHARALTASAAIAVLLTSTGALAADGGWRNGSWYGDDTPPAPSRSIDADEHTPPPPIEQRQMARPPYDHAWQGGPNPMQPGRDAWLADCRSRVGARDNGVGGAVIGGVVGGVAGNRIAGRHNRTVGTVAGAAVGAVAGSAIDRDEDRSRGRDECEAYLDDYYARYAAGAYGAPGSYGGYAQPGYAMSYAPAYGYQTSGGCCGQPVMMVPVQAQPECTETVEYIYEDVPVRHRPYHAPIKRTKIVPDKRVKLVPDKRINTK